MKYLRVILKYFYDIFIFMKVKIYLMHGTTVVRIPYNYVKDHKIRNSGFVNLREDENGNLILTPLVK